ncbi:hypothetical protein BRYFOR_08713 [Marvinbryantia formatexigens DSM 14469]|uniref:Uncharacterized protein n=1 Tax=Marvinbryantia formatexigens DSM 14469 TaxID=478749 RepID=C6LJ78_9FIRM|nr:hypothetical protein BRYFOR_08713 [Marvinbryantia formatexigens DSM 14469]
MCAICKRRLRPCGCFRLRSKRDMCFWLHTGGIKQTFLYLCADE